MARLVAAAYYRGRPLSSAWYIMLQREAPGFNHSLNGKFVARAGEVLEALARSQG